MVSAAPTTTAEAVLSGRDLTGRTVLVTGATTGIGLETARALAAAGASVVITARTPDKAVAALETLRAAVPGGDVSQEVVELQSLASVRAFTDRVGSTLGRIDVLIANAGVMAVPFGQTEDGFEVHLGTNHLAHFLLVGRLLPLLLAGTPTRVVLLSSAGHAASDIRWDDPNFERGPYDKLAAYGQSKTANILHAVELDRRYGPLGLRACAVHPGMVATDLGRHFTREDYAALKARAAAAGGALPPRVGVEVGAATSVWAVISPGLGGSYLADCAIATARPYATDPVAAQRLWALSEELVGERFPEPG